MMIVYVGVGLLLALVTALIGYPLIGWPAVAAAPFAGSAGALWFSVLWGKDSGTTPAAPVARGVHARAR